MPTSSQVKSDLSMLYREGFLLSVFLEDNSIGYGEVAPIDIHEEDLLDVEEQLRFLLHMLEGASLSFLPLLKGSFSNWIWRTIGVPPSSIYPSVRCGMEMAIVNALAAKYGSSLLDVINGHWSSLCGDSVANESNDLKSIQICALVDCNGSPKDVAHIVSQLLDEGFTTVKLKVARRENPIEDAAVIKEIREKVGFKVNLRVDANQRWTYDEAIEFGFRIKFFDLQFIEEPVCCEDDIVKFCISTGLPVALDETVDHLKGKFLEGLQKFVHPGVVAIVIKPSVVGGFENAALIAKWAQLHNKMVVVSGAYESSLSLSAYVQFAYYLEHQNAAISRVKQRNVNATMAHGLGTYRWLKEDVTTERLKILSPKGGSMEVSIQDAKNCIRHFQINQEIIKRIYAGEKIRSYRRKVEGEGFSCLFRLQEAGLSKKNRTVVYLHGFLGTSDDWIPIMKSISATARCISVDLPGHGETHLQWFAESRLQRLKLSIEFVADMLIKLISDIVTCGRVTLVGYSMGARIALYMALKYKQKITGAIIISGSPGLVDEQARKIRLAQDEARSNFILSHGLDRFLQIWYSSILWRSLKEHPNFQKVTRSRTKHNDIGALAETLTNLSIGKQVPLWEELRYCNIPLLLIVGEKDKKFIKISQQMYDEINHHQVQDNNGEKALCKVVVIPDSGHAVHLENPLPVINAVRKFLMNL